MNKTDRDPVELLVDSLVQDFLDMTDAEIAAEIVDRGDDPAAIAASSRAVFEKVLFSQGKRKLAEARLAVEADAAAPKTVLKIDAAAARNKLERMLRRFPETARKLTLAARKGIGLSDADVLGLLSNFQDLGVEEDEDK